MRHTILLFCLFLTACDRTAPAPAPPLFQTSFEEAEAGAIPTGWSVVSKAPNRVFITDDQAHDGKRSLRLVDTSTQESCGLRSPHIPVKPDTDYGATWWVLAPPETAASLYVEFWDQEGRRITEGGVTSFGARATGQWERMGGSVTSPANAVTATVLANCWTGGVTDARYDEILFAPGGAATYDRTPLPPAAVKHPCGLYRAADVKRARENVRRHAWARQVLADLRSQADFWMKLPDAQIPEWIPELTPIRVLDCPKCAANWDYAWKALPDMRIQCTRCELVLPDAAYPENATEVLVNPLGEKVTYALHKDAKGKAFRISGRLRYQRIGRLSAAGALGKVYALTGEEAYARKAVAVLRRLAEVYPGYVPHDWYKFYRNYSNLQSGKLSGWKLHDAGTFTQLALCYDLIADSGLLTEGDKVLIENGAFREAVRLFTATSPRGCCINDGPYAMTCGALLGAILGDHDAIRWAVSPPDGFLGFVHRYFFRDGHWEDGSSSYENMALGPLYGCPEVLQGYSDPPGYTGADRFDNLDVRQDPILRRIFTAQLHLLMPDGTAPPINDSAAGTRYGKAHAETNYLWYPTEENRRILAHVYGGKLEEGGEYALFRRDPGFTLEGVKPLDLSAGSQVRPGLGVGILRAGEGKDAAALYLDYGPHCSGHGHLDKLNLIFFDRGAELIPDQGYLGARHDITPWNHSTLAHNQVLIDGQAQAAAAGQLLLFQPDGPIRTIVAEAPAAYPKAARYERCTSLVDHGPGRRYVVDVFRVAGGTTHDFALHGAGRDFAAGDGPWLPLADTGIAAAAGGKRVREATYRDAPGPSRVTWSEGESAVTLDLLGQAGTRLLHLAAPGARHRSNPWEKRDAHVLVARRAGPANTFVSVIQASGPDGPAFTVAAEPVQSEQGDVQAVRVRGAGFDDLVVVGEAASAAGLTRCGNLTFRGQLAYLSRSAEGTTASLLNGSEMQAGALRLASTPPFTGKIAAVDADACSIRTDTPLPTGARYLILKGVVDGVYQVESVSAAPGGGSVVRLAGEPILNIRVGQEWTCSTFATVTSRVGGR